MISINIAKAIINVKVSYTDIASPPLRRKSSLTAVYAIVLGLIITFLLSKRQALEHCLIKVNYTL